MGFHVVVSKVRKNVSSLRYPDFKTKYAPSVPQTGCKVFSTCLARSFHLFIFPPQKQTWSVKNFFVPIDVKNVQGWFQCARMVHDRENTKNVELDVAVSLVASEVRKDVSLRSYGQLKLKETPNCF